ncbi:MAG: protein-glutamate O-methyltransferase CheR [Actinomycetota bacterium]|nr:protein-glutamate O-methyltransferase CheR [Actinomycetota bacterium]
MTDVEAGRVYRGNLTRLIDKVRNERGFDLGQYRQAYVERRVASRLRSLDLHSYRQYVDYLDGHPDEYGELLNILTINVTDFYRDSPVYDIFRRRIVPDMLDEKLRRRNRMIRAWSAGCATGQEPYSMTMSFLDGMAGHTESFLLSVTGTDLDPKALAIAQAATYDIDKLSHIPKTHQVKYIEMDGSVFHIKPEVTKHVRFRQMNLFEDRPVSMYDVIFCRNVFIYFTREQQERILDTFWSALSRGGYLVLGRSEKLAPSVAARLELVDGRERIYRKPIRP